MQSVILFLATVFLFGPVSAQRFDQLEKLKDAEVRLYYSAGHEQRAVSLADRLQRAMDFGRELLVFKPDVTVLVLTATDWPRYTKFPVYGMPHYNDEKTLVVAAEDNPFWDSFVPALDQLPADQEQRFRNTYGRADGSLSMRPFFDLLIIHELGHAFHLQAGLTIQRKWMGELFSNIFLHHYIALHEPAQLPALTLFPLMVIHGGSKDYPYTSLRDLEEKYEEIGQRHPRNYGWYQSRWHFYAGTIYEAGGQELLRNLWNALREQKTVLNDEALGSFLESKVHKITADVIRNWDRDTK